MINNPADRKKIKDALNEISNSMTRISAERDLIKDIKASLFEEFKDKLTKKQIGKMARVYHKQNFKEECEESTEFETLYESVVLLGTPQS